MASAVETNVYDQSTPGCLRDIVAMKLGESRRSHVGDVNVADAPLSTAMDFGSIRQDPITISGGSLIGEASDSYFATITPVSARHRKNHLAFRMNEEGFWRRPLRRCAMADLQDSVTDRQPDPRRDER